MMGSTMISTSAKNFKSSTMTDFDSIWRTQDEIRTVVNAVLGALDLGRLLPAGRKNASGTWPMMKDVVPSFLN